jgi:hypothetical protein
MDLGSWTEMFIKKGIKQKSEKENKKKFDICYPLFDFVIQVGVCCINPSMVTQSTLDVSKLFLYTKMKLVAIEIFIQQK